MNTTTQLTRSALFAALVTLAVYFFRLPVADGRLIFHLGETVIVTGVYFLGRRNGALAAALGTALADLLMGAAIWAPFSFVFHGIQAWVIGTLIDRQLGCRDFFAMVAGALCVIVGYATVSWWLYDISAVPVSLIGDSMQTSFGVVTALLVLRGIRKIRPESFKH